MNGPRPAKCDGSHGSTQALRRSTPPPAAPAQRCGGYLPIGSEWPLCRMSSFMVTGLSIFGTVFTLDVSVSGQVANLLGSDRPPQFLIARKLLRSDTPTCFRENLVGASKMLRKAVKTATFFKTTIFCNSRCRAAVVVAVHHRQALRLNVDAVQIHDRLDQFRKLIAYGSAKQKECCWQLRSEP